MVSRTAFAALLETARTEIDEELSLTIFGSSRLKPVAEKIDSGEIPVRQLTCLQPHGA
jgi:hypothetical protein